MTSLPRIITTMSQNSVADQSEIKSEGEHNPYLTMMDQMRQVIEKGQATNIELFARLEKLEQGKPAATQSEHEKEKERREKERREKKENVVTLRDIMDDAWWQRAKEQLAKGLSISVMAEPKRKKNDLENSNELENGEGEVPSITCSSDLSSPDEDSVDSFGFPSFEVALVPSQEAMLMVPPIDDVVVPLVADMGNLSVCSHDDHETDDNNGNGEEICGFTSNCHEKALHGLLLQRKFQDLGSQFSLIPSVPPCHFRDPFLHDHISRSSSTNILSPLLGYTNSFPRGFEKDMAQRRAMCILVFKPPSTLLSRVIQAVYKHVHLCPICISPLFSSALKYVGEMKTVTLVQRRQEYVYTSCEQDKTQMAEKGIKEMDSRTNPFKGGEDDTITSTFEIKERPRTKKEKDVFPKDQVVLSGHLFLYK